MQLSERAKGILCDKELMNIRERWIDRLTSIFDGTADNDVFYIRGISDWFTVGIDQDPEEWIVAALERLADSAEAMRDERCFRPLCLEFGPYGVHYVSKLFGCEVKRNATSGQWYCTALENEIGTLKAPVLEENELFLHTKKAVEAFNKQGVTLPFFGLPTVASALNVIMNIYGSRVLYAMFDEPDELKKDIDTIADTLCALHEYFRNALPQEQLQPVVALERMQPYGYGQICGCTSQLLSDESYAEFFADADRRVLGVYPNGGMIHLCGSHLQHAEQFGQMKELRAFQLNDRAAEDYESYLAKLPDDSIFYVAPCEGMPLKRILEIGGKSGRLVVQGEPE